MYAVMTDHVVDHDDPLPDGLEPLLHLNGADQEQLAQWRARPHARVLLRAAPVDDAATAQLETRNAALSLAGKHDGMVVDLTVPRIIGSQSPRLEHSDQWVLVHYELADEGAIATRGLSSFGLPELRVVIPSGAPTVMCGAVTSGLTHRLLAEWPQVDPIGPAVITLRDISFGLGDPDADSVPTERGVQVLIDYDAEAHELVVDILDDPALLFA